MNRFHKYIFFCLILFAVLADSLFAYRNVGKGKEFWFAFTSGGFNGNLMICAEKATSGTISFPLMGWSKDFYVPDSSITSVGLNELWYLNKGRKNTVSDFGVHVVSNEVVTIFSSDDSNIGDHSIILPVEALGSEYIISTYDQGSLAGEQQNDCVFFVVATDSNTKVEITKQTKYLGSPAVQDPPQIITMNKGQTYFVAEEGDLTGTFIKSLDSTKLIAVFAGNEKAIIDKTCREVKEMFHPVWDQLYPMDMLGTEYAVLPYKYRRNGNIIRILATEDFTTVNITSNHQVKLDKGNYYDTIAYEPVIVRGDKPLSVTLFSRNKICDTPIAWSDSIGEPTMLQLLPTSNMYSGSVFFRNLVLGAFNSKRWVTNIFIKSMYIDQIFLDGKSISSYFMPVKNLPGFSYATIDLNFSVHRIYSDFYYSASHYAFCANNEEYEWDGGYSFALGAGRSYLKFSTNPGTPICATLPIEFIGDAPDEIKYFYWDMGNGDQKTGKIISYSYPIPGTYTVTLRCRRDMQENEPWDVHQRVITVLPFEKPVIVPDKLIICPGEQIRLNVYQRFSEYHWNNGEDNSSIKVNKAGTYTVTIVDTNGCVGQTSVEIKEYSVIKPELGINGPQEFCQGDSTILFVKNKFLAYKWSNGDSVSSIVVKSSDTYRVIGIDSNGCQSFSDPIVVTVYQNPLPIVNGPNSVCKNTIADYFANVFGTTEVKWTVSGGTILTDDDSSGIRVQWGGYGLGYVKCWMKNPATGCVGIDSIPITIDSTLKPHLDLSNPYLCEGESVIITAPTGYNQYEWSTGDTTNEITVTKAGSYFLKVKGSAGCNGVSETVVIQEVPKPKPIINSPPYLCNGETITLSTTENYEHFLWNTGDTISSISINTPGKYSVTVKDSKGCDGFAEIDIQSREVKMSQLLPVNFGKSKIGKVKTKKISLKNLSKDSTGISGIYVTGPNSAQYSIKSNPAVPCMLGAADIIEIELSFLPTIEKTYSDSLIVEIKNPCDKNSSAPIIGIGSFIVVEAIISSVDTIAKIGEKGFRIPIYGAINLSDTVLSNQSYSATVSFDKDYFYPESISKGRLTKNIVSGDSRLVTFEDSLVNFTNKKVLLTEIIGTTLLGEKGKTPIKIEEFILPDPDIFVNTEEGSLELVGVCQQTISQIKQSDALMVMVNNVIYANNLKLEIRNLPDNFRDYSMNMNLYSVYGDKSAEFNLDNMQKESKGTYLLSKDISNLVDGKYFLVLRFNNTILINQILIVR